MAEAPKLLYVVVVDNEDKKEGKENDSFRYTRPLVQGTLQLMGCKARHAFKISQRVFEVMRRKYPGDAFPLARKNVSTVYVPNEDCNKEMDNKDVKNQSDVGEDETINSRTFELYKIRSTVIVRRETFIDVVCSALSEYKYISPNQRADLVMACRIRERKESMTVLLCGTSGCGKSTLSALLGSRLGITTVISTDSIRHMMRSFVDEKENPLLWASTYHAGEHLDPVEVAKAKAKRKAKKLARDGTQKGRSDTRTSDSAASTPGLISPRQMAVEGYKAQSEMVIDSLDRLITAWEERKESVVVEGVHLSLNFVMGLMKKHPSIVPFMIYITNEEKHLERFAVRAKYMTLDPARNKYVKYIRNIRTIQDYLCNRADKHLVPKINNTNVDRSVAAIHATVFSCLRRREVGEQLYDPTTNTVSVVDEEYRNQCAANTLTSKGMFQLIQRKGSSRHLMALLNTDGSVAKAWPFASNDYGNPILGTGNEKSIGCPMYGPLQIGKSEPVNLQFGNFGISAFPSDTGGTSRSGSVAGSLDEFRSDGVENGSKYYSSCCSSPRMSDGPSKELKEKVSVSGSDEEADDPPDADTDEDLSDEDDKQIHEEMEGSVDEESTKSDEEYDDLAMRDGQDNGYWTDYEDEFKKRLDLANKNGITPGDRYPEDLNLMKTSSEPLCLNPLVMSENHQRPMRISGTARMRRRSLSIPAMGRRGSLVNEPILSGTPQG